MKCRFCQAELPDGEWICPACGQDNAQPEQTPEEPVQIPEAAGEENEEERLEEVPEEEPAEALPEAESGEESSGEEAPEDEPSGEESPADTPAEEAVPAPDAATVKKNRKKEVIRTVAGLLVGALLLGALTVAAYFKSGSTGGTGVLTKASYSADADQARASSGQVVATVGSAELTNGQLQVYYWMQFYDMLNYYSYYLPFDYTQPLDTQVMSEESGMTWQQYILDLALESWHRYQTLSFLAEENGFVLPAEMQENLDTTAERMESMAQEGGYENVTAMMEREMGPGVSLDDYVRYLKVYYQGYQYLSEQFEALAPTDEEIEAYYSEHTGEFEENGVVRGGNPMVDVRHILITPEGGTTDENGATTYSEAEWEACRAEAQAILDEWLAGEATEESFSELAAAHSVDGGSASNGGLYTGVVQGQMVEPFENWCFDESRQIGDYGLVRTEYGYHVMYFVGDTWFTSAESALMADRATAMVEEAMENYPMEVDYRNIALGTVDLGTSGAE